MIDKIFKIIKGSQNKQPRIQISKKVVKLSTKRNRIRRIIKENIRKLKENGFDKIIVLEDISTKKTNHITKYLK